MTEAALQAILPHELNVPIRFWSCPVCTAPRIKWTDRTAVCLECGRTAEEVAKDRRITECQEALKEALKLFQIGHDFALAVSDMQDRTAIHLSEQRARIHHQIQAAIGNTI